MDIWAKNMVLMLPFRHKDQYGGKLCHIVTLDSTTDFHQVDFFPLLTWRRKCHRSLRRHRGEISILTELFHLSLWWRRKKEVTLLPSNKNWVNFVTKQSDGGELGGGARRGGCVWKRIQGEGAYCSSSLWKRLFIVVYQTEREAKTEPAFFKGDRLAVGSQRKLRSLMRGSRERSWNPNDCLAA